LVEQRLFNIMTGHMTHSGAFSTSDSRHFGCGSLSSLLLFVAVSLQQQQAKDICKYMAQLNQFSKPP
jgi:hypothetical protein